MANTLQLRRRIQTAQNVSKTTRAMQMIAASKLKKAQDAALSARPYVEKLTQMSQDVLSRVSENAKHPYLQSNGQSNKTLLLVFAPDKGLCGGLITNLIRKLLEFDRSNDALYISLGKKIEHPVALLDREIIASFPFGNTLPSFDAVFPLSQFIDEYFVSGKVAKVQVLSTNFQSIFTQTPMLTTVLPVEIATDTRSHFSLFEPGEQELLPQMLKHYLEMTLYRHLLESYLSEQAARMLSMQNATNNANDMIEDLKLEYNKLRQERITSEILDISSAKTVS